jgi:DNA-binding TFAR19-related protein (PDSD5 family)
VVGGTNQETLELRRNALLDEMRETLERTRTRRVTVAAALENVRIQLLRIGAGMGTADDMNEEVAILSALVESNSEGRVAAV